MTARLLIVVPGLAASGKTTVARALGAGLSRPLLDKDDILEALFDSLGCADRDRRQQLSRASDHVLLRSAAESLVEVHFECPVEGGRFALHRSARQPQRRRPS